MTSPPTPVPPTTAPPTSLAQELAQVRARSRASPEQRQVFTRATEDLRASGIQGEALGAGEMAPDFALPSADGRLISLESLIAGGPAVIVFYRGGWCPYCNITLCAFESARPEIERLGGRMIAVSPERPEHAADTRRNGELGFEVLSDADGRVARLFGLWFTLPEALVQTYRALGIDLPARNGGEDWALPMPATYVVGRDGVVAYAFVEADYTRRAEPAAVVAALARLATQKG